MGRPVVHTGKQTVTWNSDMGVFVYECVCVCVCVYVLVRLSVCLSVFIPGCNLNKGRYTRGGSHTRTHAPIHTHRPTNDVRFHQVSYISVNDQ